jgi:hypothetical protein
MLTALLEQAGFTDVKFRTSGLSSLTDWFRNVNKVDRTRDSRGTRAVPESPDSAPGAQVDGPDLR